VDRIHLFHWNTEFLQEQYQTFCTDCKQKPKETKNVSVYLKFRSITDKQNQATFNLNNQQNQTYWQLDKKIHWDYWFSPFHTQLWLWGKLWIISNLWKFYPFQWRICIVCSVVSCNAILISFDIRKDSCFINLKDPVNSTAVGHIDRVSRRYSNEMAASIIHKFPRKITDGSICAVKSTTARKSLLLQAYSRLTQDSF
jgi:hypothetical protein